MKILIAGDFVPQNRTANQIESGDYSCIDAVKPLTTQCDYSIVNFESPVVDGTAEPISKTGPNLKCHRNALLAVKQAGFNCVTLANNHFYDYGEKGVHDTIAACKKMSVDYVGGGMNLEEAESILYKECDGKTLAILNFCENEWSIATATTGGSAPLHLTHNIRNIQNAKKNADYVLVIVHGGTEKYPLPTPRMKDVYRFFVEQGADAVVNHHQHCYSGYEVHQNKPIIYGLGNFCFDKNKPTDINWNTGYVVVLDFSNEKNCFQLYPFIQGGETPAVEFINDPKNVFANIQHLNAIIADEEALKKAFETMACSKTKLIEIFEPFKNKYLRLLQSKKIIPKTFSDKKKKQVLDLFRCESHRDIMFYLFQNED